MSLSSGSRQAAAIVEKTLAVENLRTLCFCDVHIVKVGSQSLLTGDGEVNQSVFDSLAKQIAALSDNKLPAIVVTSGAVAAGRHVLGSNTFSREACAAVGQPLIVQAWRAALQTYALSIAQICVTGAELRDHSQYLAEKLKELISSGVIPILNADDIFNPLCSASAEASDNDVLAARVAALVQARKLFLLIAAEGVIKDGEKLAVINAYEDLSFLSATARSQSGTGGILTKVEIAQSAARAGCEAIIGNAACGTILSASDAGTRIPALTSTYFAEDLGKQFRTQVLDS